MKYVLFALSILLLLIGGYSIFTGLPIIEVERGWASVIAGTTAFVGGALLFGIGWVVRALERLRAAVLAAEKIGAPAPLAPAAVDFRSDEMLKEDRRPLRPETAAPIAWPPQTSAAAHAAHIKQDEGLRAAYAARSERREELRQDIRQDVRDGVRQDVRQEVRDGVRDEMFEENEEFAAEAESILREPFTEEDRPAPEKAAANIRDLWRRNAKAGEKKSRLSRPFQKKPPGAVASVFAAHPKPIAAANAPHPESQDDDFANTGAGNETGDWIQSNFSQAGTASESHSGLDDVPADFDAYETVAEKHVAPPTAADANEAETGDVEEPAVIGHYEAEGTSYTMFSDGSIEAQSERGVARFNSMADLKAFFETQETPQ